MLETWTTFDFVLALGVITALAVTIFLFTLPTSYTHFHPGYLKESDFNARDRADATRSGYAYFQRHKNHQGHLAVKTSVQVVVLGDIGRSPRMQYHALSLAACGASVQLVGYVESETHPDILASRFISVCPFSSTPRWLQARSRLHFLLTAPVKVLYQTIQLYRVLAYHTTASRFMLVQNPPSIPLLAIVSVVCFFRNTRLVIDWHNFGYTILALKLGDNHPLVRVSKLYEHVFARVGEQHFAVTDAMRRVLSTQFGAKAVTLHDRPAEQFQPFSAKEKDDFLTRCALTQRYAMHIRDGKWRVLVSPTSWTADEDFEMLLSALVSYSASITGSALPKLLVIITGKGPLREHFAGRIEALEQASKLEHVKVCQAWLSVSDYASLLASADLGISLHTSSSGVDLPMKVLDMFGAGLPAAGWSSYEAWPELVHEGINGVGFGSAEELTQLLSSLFANEGKRLGPLKKGAIAEGDRRWHAEWTSVAASVFGLQV